MKVFESGAILVIIGIVLAGAVFGALLGGSHGIFAEVGGVILGGIAGWLAGLNAIGVAIRFWRLIAGGRQYRKQKEADKDK